MTTKYINGSYPSGYVIQNQIDTLNIGPSAQLSASKYGLATEADRTTGVDIDNSGSIFGSSAGVKLYRGGTVTNLGSITGYHYGSGSVYGGLGVQINGDGKVVNGSATNTGAKIGGLAGVSIIGKGFINNFGTIYSAKVSNHPGYRDNLTIYMGSGTIINSGDITAGVGIGSTSVSGSGGGVVLNNGFIGNRYANGYSYSGGLTPHYYRDVWAGVTIVGGGDIVNGTKNHAAVIGGGVSITGGRGTVVNDATINNDCNIVYGFKTFTRSITLGDGGDVFNGTAGDTGAKLNGSVSIGGGDGEVKNFGFIGHSTESDNYSSTNRNINRVSVQLGAGGTIINGAATDTSAKIDAGVSVTGGIGTIDNFGTIGYGSNIAKKATITTAILYAGAAFADGGTVINGSATDTAAKIDGGAAGVSISGGSGRVSNFGSIYTQAGTSNFAAGVLLAAGGSIANGSSGSTAASITGYDTGIYVAGAAGAITNYGHIGETSAADAAKAVGTQAGVDLKAGGVVRNGSSARSAASISGVVGIDLYGTGTVTNYGSINGTQSAIVFHDATDKLIENASGLLTGAVAGGGGSLILDGKTGTLSGLGSTVTGFAKIDVTSDSAWVLAGHGLIAAGTIFRNDGRVAVAASDTLTLDTGMVGSGVLAIRPGATTEIKGNVSATETVTFTGGNAELTLDSPGLFLGAVSNLMGGGTDKLKLIGFGKGTTFTFTPNGGDTGGTLAVTDGAKQAQITLLGQFVASGFHAAVSASYTVFTYTASAAATPHLAPSA